MLNLSDREWRSFEIGDLFNVSGTTTTHPSILKKDGDTPRITCQAVNNGLEGFYVNEPTEKGGVLTIDSATDGAINYQGCNFIATDHVEKISRKDGLKIDRYSGLFLVWAIKAAIGNKYSYGYKFSQNRIRKQVILLPVTHLGEPDYDFMASFAKEREIIKRKEYLEFAKAQLAQIERERERERVDSAVRWFEFRIEDLFEIKSGKRLVKSNMISGDRPFIGASDSNNGITMWCSNTNGTLDSNVLGVNYNGSVVENFYHPYECIFSDDVKRFHLKETSEDKYVYLFLKTVIIQQKIKYRYAYKFNEKRMRRQMLVLPATDDDKPNYNYMRAFMKEKIAEKYSAYIDYSKSLI